MITRHLVAAARCPKLHAFFLGLVVLAAGCTPSEHVVEASASSARSRESASPTSRSKTTSQSVAVIPRPVRMNVTGAWRTFGPIGTIGCDETARPIAVVLSDHVHSMTGVRPRVEPIKPRDRQSMILIETNSARSDLGDEGYALKIDSTIHLQAQTDHGLFNGLQTLRQLMDQAGIENDSGASAMRLPACDIVDHPRFKWRGMHLDVSRHFMPVDFVKRFIDLLAYHKFNVFHWHLTDDQGWRIEIKRYPKLTRVGAWRDTLTGRYGGFYTQAEIRDVVAYAAERFVTIVPEIEMPGHSMAALAAYPALSCTGGPFKVPAVWGVFDDVYCAGKDEPFEFLANVLDEVCGLFPGQYVHVGGDECLKRRWKECPKCQARIANENLDGEAGLQSWFMHRAGEMLAARGRRMIGWDEILEGGLAPDATVMSWRGMDGGITAATDGHDVVMCPTSHCYFDYRQSHALGERGPIWAGVTDLEKVYSFEPIPAELHASLQSHILGAQGNLWTEWMETPAHVEYMAFPRAIALSEVLWSAKDGRDWAGFLERLAVHLKRLDAMRVRYRGGDHANSQSPATRNDVWNGRIARF